MGKRAQRSLLTEGMISFILSVGLLAVFFLAGMILGQVYAEKNSDAIAIELHRYLIDYCGMDSAADRDGWVFFSALIIYFRYPLLTAFLGVWMPGALLLPVVASVFGFFISYAVCCFARAFGMSGIMVGAIMFGPRCLITLPCFLVLAVPMLQLSLSHVAERFFYHRKRFSLQGTRKSGWLSICIVLAVLFLAVFAETFLMPVLLKKVFALLI